LEKTLNETFKQIEKFKEQGGNIDVDQECLLYTNKQLELTRAQWSAAGRTMSTMITGPSGFNSRRAEKRNRTHQLRSEEAWGFAEKALKRIKRKAFPHGAPGEPVRSNDPDGIAKLSERLEAMQKQQQLMKEANALARKGAKRPKDEYEDFLRDEKPEWNDNLINSLVSIFPQKPFESFQLTNLNAKIKANQRRTEDLQRMKDRGGSTEQFMSGVKVVEDIEAARIQLIFDGKPSATARKILKSHGMRWAPSVGESGAWQRHLNRNGRSAVYNWIKPKLEAIQNEIFE
jgi:hypothetical protein